MKSASRCFHILIYYDAQSVKHLKKSVSGFVQAAETELLVHEETTLIYRLNATERMSVYLFSVGITGRVATAF
jgi:hypothetical protein